MGCKRCGKTITKGPPVIQKASPMPRSSGTKLILETGPTLEENLALTATVRDLHDAYPGMFVTGIMGQGDFGGIWANNPYIAKLKPEESRVVVLDYGVMGSQKDFLPHHMLEALTRDLELKIGIRIPCSGYQGQIFLSDQEKKWGWGSETGLQEGPFWVINTGTWTNRSSKWWNPANFQEVVDLLNGKVTFVQIGTSESPSHPKLRGVVDFVGQLGVRQVVRLVYHAVGVLSVPDFVMHLAAAVPPKIEIAPRKPCVVVGGGSEPANWYFYPNHRVFSTQGALKCCLKGSCGRKYVFSDEKSRDLGSAREFCTNSVKIGDISVAKCMNIIKPRDVADAILSYYEGGALK